MKSFFLSPEQFGKLKEKYGRFNESWTGEETEELRRMAADGLDRSEMSAQLGRSPNAVKMKLQSLGLYVPKPSAKPWTPLDDDALVKAYREGATFASLAAAFGRSENAVITRLVRLRAAFLPEAAADRDRLSKAPTDNEPASSPGQVTAFPPHEVCGGKSDNHLEISHLN